MTWSGAEPGRRRLTRAEQPPRYLVPECRESIGVIHRDDDILVINKPAFLLSVPGRAPENSDCVTRRLSCVALGARISFHQHQSGLCGDCATATL